MQTPPDFPALRQAIEQAIAALPPQGANGQTPQLRRRYLELAKSIRYLRARVEALEAKWKQPPAP